MIKKVLLLSLIIGLPLSCFAFIKGGQYKTAMEFADPGQAPVVMLDPEGKALGYVLYHNLDNKPGNEYIIAYKRRKKDRDIENNALVTQQELVIELVRGREKIPGFIKVDLGYTRNPKPYVTVKKLPGRKFPTVFLMIFDGLDRDNRGPDKKYIISFNSFDPKDWKIKDREHETVKMPWRFILYQFDEKIPVIVEFDIKTKENFGQFFIRTLYKDDKWPKFPMKSIEKFKEKLMKYREYIYWEYGFE